MTVLRHYFISDDLDDLTLLEQQLEEGGVDASQTHVLSLDDQNLDGYEHLRDVSSIMKKDVIRSGVIGTIIGLALSRIIIVSGCAIWLGRDESRLDALYTSCHYYFWFQRLGRWLVWHSNTKQKVCPI